MKQNGETALGAAKTPEATETAPRIRVPAEDRPILVVGNGRSGTTWIGETLSFADGTQYFNEPCHPNPNGLRGASADAVWTRYVSRDGDDAYFRSSLGRAFKGARCERFARVRAMARRRLLGRNRIVIKEVAAFLSAAWVIRNWSPQVLVVVRHPAAYALSVKNLNANKQEVDRLKLLVNNRAMQAEHTEALLPYLRDVEDPIEASVASWAIRNYVVLRQLRDESKRKLVHYEKLAAEPVAEFERLYAHCNLRWRNSIRETIANRTSHDSPGQFSTARVSKNRIDAWRKGLTAGEILRIRKTLEPFKLGIYNGAEHW